MGGWGGSPVGWDGVGWEERSSGRAFAAAGRPCAAPNVVPLDGHVGAPAGRSRHRRAGQEVEVQGVDPFALGLPCAAAAATAELAAKFMFAMSYYHERMKLHIMLHPLFFVAGFLAAYWML